MIRLHRSTPHSLLFVTAAFALGAGATPALAGPMAQLVAGRTAATQAATVDVTQVGLKVGKRGPTARRGGGGGGGHLAHSGPAHGAKSGHGGYGAAQQIGPPGVSVDKIALGA